MNVRRRALALAAVAALAIAAVPAPALAAALDGCAPGDHAARDTFVGRDGVTREKDTGQAHRDLPARAKGKAPADFSATVPVYFHVIADGSVGSLTDRQIRAQIAVLNDGFDGSEGGTNTGFTFTLAGTTRTDNAAWFALSGSSETQMKQALKQGGDNAMNVYSTSGAGALGWAYFPSITESSQSYLDGVVINWETVPGASDTWAGQFDLGKTLTHEAGHWVNLEHTFFGGCNKGDFVDDTPAEKTPTSGCPADKDTCKAPGLDPVHNYMDYSYDSCYTQFTPGQTQRMRDAWLFYRAS